MKKQIANFITLSRILLGITLLFLSPFSTVFYVVYISAGISDMIDGPIARITHSQSDFGSKLDTISDMVFFFCCVWKLFPYINLPYWIWIWSGVILITKVIIMVRDSSLPQHTLQNKITGFLMFIFPLTMAKINPLYGAVLLCTITTCISFSDICKSILKEN